MTICPAEVFMSEGQGIKCSGLVSCPIEASCATEKDVTVANTRKAHSILIYDLPSGKVRKEGRGKNIKTSGE
jgi:hypothetical protein